MKKRFFVGILVVIMVAALAVGNVAAQDGIFCEGKGLQRKVPIFGTANVFTAEGFVDVQKPKFSWSINGIPPLPQGKVVILALKVDFVNNQYFPYKKILVSMEKGCYIPSCHLESGHYLLGFIISDKNEMELELGKDVILYGFQL